MPTYPLLTYQDLIDHALDYLGVDAGPEARRDARRAAQLALSDLATAHQWMYYLGRGRIATVAAYSTGTIEYDHTGGVAERLVTLTSGAFPSWAALGSFIIDNAIYEVASRLSDSQLTLTSASNPGDDLTAGTTYTLYQDTYPLPADFVAMGVIVIQGLSVLMYTEPAQTWLERQRIYRGLGIPRFASVRGSPDHFGGLAFGVFPPPDDVYNIDYLYQRRPRPLTIEGYSTGSATVGSGSTVVSGTGTSWTSRHVGTVFRPSLESGVLPTGFAGDNPAPWERIVTAVNSATSLTLDVAAPEALVNVPYLLTDPVDIEQGAMRTALLRNLEFQLAISRNRKGQPAAEAAWTKALIVAREADSRNFRSERAGTGVHWPTRLADFPSAPDVL